jgi:sugar phosphate isomerase/epimerase
VTTASDPALLSLNTATVRAQWKLEEIIAGCERHGIRGIAPWRDQIAELGLKETTRLIRAAGLTVTGVCRGGFFTSRGRAGLAAATDENRRAIDEAAALSAQCLVLVVGGLAERSKDIAAARGLVEEGIASILDHARASGVRLAIEPLHPMYAADRACINTVAQANVLCEKFGAGLGVAVDVYHVWWDPELEHTLAGIDARRLLGFHICDWLAPTTDLLNDRGMMGDGVIDIRRIRGWMQAAGYRGFHEVEIFSASNWWKRDPDEVLRTCKLRHAEVC